MERQAARQIIEKLADGIHPLTGLPLPQESPYNAPTVIRALFSALRMFDAHEAMERKRRLPAPNAGKPWHTSDDELLRATQEAGRDPRELSGQLGRTPFAIEARMAKLGLTEPQPGIRLSPLKVREPARRYRVRPCMVRAYAGAAA